MNPVLQNARAAGFAVLRRYGWFPIAILLVHEFLAHVVDGYLRWPAIDVPMHFCGGLAVAYFAGGSLRVFSGHRLIREPDAVLKGLFLFSLVNTVAVFWEFGEFASDRLLGTTYQLGLGDTLLDLFMGMLGGLAYLAPRLPAARRALAPPAPETSA